MASQIDVFREHYKYENNNNSLTEDEKWTMALFLLKDFFDTFLDHRYLFIFHKTKSRNISLEKILSPTKEHTVKFDFLTLK